MYNIISIVGTSDSGKTTLIEKLTTYLTEKGYKIATIKHDAHSFEIDKEGKDSYRHKQAGAKTVIISSSEKIAMINSVNKEPTLDELMLLLPEDIDLVITEGYKRSNKPKIEVFRTSHSREFLCKDDNTLVAVATDDLNAPELENVNNKFFLDNIEDTATFIENNYIKKENNDNILLFVNGRQIHLNEFVKNTLMLTINALVKPLKGASNAKNIWLKIKNK
ncbi:MAG: molybdopterin-guanine dinucleotide biosynthesis protein B [Deferribacterota bacterium]|nr:molybdopterin-guanine dinucleotide biosynthesis protein B [Deferribacterota bacterium]